jgi:hypothetical protein
MPNLRRPSSLLVVAGLVVATMAGIVAPARVNALEPPRPLPGPRPEFVTETDTRPWNDCLWASASMLLDKWTNGDVRISHERLRRLSGDLHGGSSFEDLQVALRRLGFRITLGPGGDSTITWGGLLARLRRGAGAVVMGDYGNLPRWYGRWDIRFWRSKGKKKNDNHAIYVERYDARRGRVWIMDPLARGDYRGEWLSVGDLYRFAWFSGGRVQAVTTPTAKPAPFKGVRLGTVAFERSTTALVAVWPLRSPRRWRFPGADARITIRRADDALAAAAAAATTSITSTDVSARSRPSATAAGRTMRATTALPERPGAYLVSFRVTDRRFGRRVAATSPVPAFVPGPRRATTYLHSAAPDQPAGGTLPVWSDAIGGGMVARAASEQPAGGAMPVWLTVTNSGSETWADPGKRTLDGGALQRATRVTATWIRLDRPGSTPGDARLGAVAAGDGFATTVLREVALAPGASVTFDTRVDVPVEPGRWALVIDVVDDVDGSFAALGSQPAVGLYEVVAPPVSDPVGFALD